MNLAASSFFFFFFFNSNTFDYPHMHALLTPTPAFAEDLSSGLEPHDLANLDAVPRQELREDAPEGSLLAHCFGLEAPLFLLPHLPINIEF
jgi:hypothetical protein